MIRVFFCVLLFGIPAGAQVLQLSAGSSTLFNGTGGEVTAFFPKTTLNASVGIENGRLAYGISDTFDFRGYEVTAGDKTFGYSFDGAGLGINTRGLFVKRKFERTTFAVFLGATGVGYFTPFMTTARPQHIGAGFYLEHKFSDDLVITSLGVVNGGLNTAIQGISYKAHGLHLSGSGGMLQSRKYFTGEADYQPIRALSLSATHIDYFLTDNLTANSLSAFTSLGHLTFQGSVLDGHYKTLSTTGASAGAGIRLGSLSFRSTFYESNHQILLVHVAQANFRHWMFSGIVDQSNGRTSYSAGGGYHGNILSVTLDHSVLFFPVRADAFQQTTTVQVSLRLHDSTINFQTNVDPMMHVQYTAYASSYVQGPMAGFAINNHTYSKGGKFVIAGAVVDEKGAPVSGAAIGLGRNVVVYSDSQGAFFARVKHNKPMAIVVLMDEFAVGGRWTVAECPLEAVPGTLVQIKMKREMAH